MKKIVLSLIFSIGFFYCAFSQTTPPAPTKPTAADTSKTKIAPVPAPVVPPKKVSKQKLAIGVDTGLPVGQAGTFYSVIFGAAVKLELPLGDSPFNFVVATGFDNFSVKGTYYSRINSANYIPLEVGAKYFFNKIFYMEGDLGASFVASSNYAGPGTAFVFSPAIGLIPTTDKSAGGMDLSLRYESRLENSTAISQIALRIAVKFGL